MQDRFVKTMLVVVAGLLAANLVQSFVSGSAPSAPVFVSNAQAATNQNAAAVPVTYQVKSLKGFTVEDLQSIVPVGDGRSFVASNSKGFMVYQVLPNQVFSNR